MKIKEQTRKLAAGCSKHCFEVVDKTDKVSNHTYGKVKLTGLKRFLKNIKILKILSSIL
ncbi:hypothetical protein [Streptococcus pneumoniae]|uniref:hypothetical protein n=1 Tax=Streptococcus pneumoniae TaxID=1313 RepID=UPI0006833428|nr:hypothetical protein [Streptococcus pneumoniae]